MSTHAQKTPSDVKDLKALYAQSFALVTPANKDADENHLIVPIKPMAVGSSVNPDQPCIPTSDAESGHTSSPISQITNMDTEDYTFNNIDPLPYNDEQIALYGCLGNQFVDFMNSPDGDEVENSFILTANDIDDEEQLPNLPEVESMTTVSPYPFSFYPPHWPLFSGPPPTYYCGKYAYITHPDDHSATSASILYPKPPSNRRFGQPLLTSPEQQDLIQEANENDVLCGRGGAINNHPGNRRFRDLINEFKYQYLHESKQTKPKVAMRVLELVKQSNPPGRFLMKFPQGYLECSEDRAKEKASQALREGAAKLRKEGYGEKRKEEKISGGLVVKSITLPNERAGNNAPHYSDDAKYCDQFEPPRPRKKAKQESVEL